MANGEVLPEMLDRLQDRHVAAAIRRIEVEHAREMWPTNVNEVLRLLAAKVADQEARIASLEARLG